MIDEKRLIEELNFQIENCERYGHSDIYLDVDVAKGLHELLNQPKVNEWIPVDERLPELAGYRCLATIENKYGQRKVADVFTNYGMYGVSPFWLSNAKEIDLSVWKVIAWQPLPNPYVKEK